MKDCNGVEVNVGDHVRFFGLYLDEEFFLGTIIGFEKEIYRWDNKDEEKDVALIEYDNIYMKTWRRWSEDFYLVKSLPIEVKEKPCSHCGKINDIGVKCYWCGELVK